MVCMWKEGRKKKTFEHKKYSLLQREKAPSLLLVKPLSRVCVSNSLSIWLTLVVFYPHPFSPFLPRLHPLIWLF